MNRWHTAEKAGCVFYVLPDELDYKNLDPLIAPICEAINSSGWVATGESCQGHPDATGYAWGLSPFLRLTCHKDDFGLMLAMLLESADVDVEHDLLHGLTLRLLVHTSSGDWRQIYAYIETRTIGERDQGLFVFKKFANRVTAVKR